MAVPGGAGADLRQRGHGLQRVGAGGAGAFSAALSLRDPAADVGRGRRGGVLHRDARRLSELPEGPAGAAPARGRPLLLVAVPLSRPDNGVPPWLGDGGFGDPLFELATLARI